MRVTCLLCRKTYDINESDHQYLRLKNKQSNHYVCKNCNNNLQQEARSNVDYNPSILDPKGFEKLL